MARYPLRWGDLQLPRRNATKHFLVAGATGSGKTSLLRGLHWSIARSDEPYRQFHYDGKAEDLPCLYRMHGVTEEQARLGTSRIRVLHPFDRRCSAWNLARDIDSPLAARQFAALTVPRGHRNQSGEASEFFGDAVRDLKAGVILAFKNCTPNQDSFEYRDVLLAMAYEPYLRFVMDLKETRDGQPFLVTQRLKRRYLDAHPRTVEDILTTSATKLGGFEAVAACWDRSMREGRRPFSLAEWAEDGCQDILVLGNDDASREVMDPVNQAIFRRAVEVALARREATPHERDQGENQTIFVLDEVREAGQLEGLGRLLNKGRSKNCVVILGFQAIEGMLDVYGQNVAHELCGQCAHLAVLKLPYGQTAEWGVDLFGHRLTTDISGTFGTDTEGRMNRSTQAGENVRSWLQTDDFIYLPDAGPEHGIWGYVRTPEVDPELHDLWMHLPWDEVLAMQPPPPDGTGWRAPHLRRPQSEMYLRPWDKDDWERLGFPGEPPPWTDPPKPEGPPPPEPSPWEPSSTEPSSMEPYASAPSGTSSSSPAPRGFPGLRPIRVEEF